MSVVSSVLVREMSVMDSWIHIYMNRDSYMCVRIWILAEVLLSEVNNWFKTKLLNRMCWCWSYFYVPVVCRKLSAIHPAFLWLELLFTSRTWLWRSGLNSFRLWIVFGSFSIWISPPLDLSCELAGKETRFGSQC